MGPLETVDERRRSLSLSITLPSPPTDATIHRCSLFHSQRTSRLTSNTTTSMLSFGSEKKGKEKKPRLFFATHLLITQQGLFYLSGLLYFLQALEESMILLSPMTLTKNPFLCLQTISEYQATHSVGPNFTLELVVRKLESAKDKKMLGYSLSSMSFVHLTALFSYSQQVLVTGYGLAEKCVICCCAFGEKKPILVDWKIRVCRAFGGTPLLLAKLMMHALQEQEQLSISEQPIKKAA
ncbi:hypothetical protein L1887_08933 [Cichorium endivia]|nr:hypothetical protein L1887_08933 [Cichorium endivia]